MTKPSIATPLITPLAALLAVGAIGFAASSSASTVRAVSVDEMLWESALIFEGRVLSVEARPGLTSTTVRTCVSFDVIDVVKGLYPDEQIELCFAGGTLGELQHSIGGMEYPQVGDAGIYFAESPETFLVNPIYGWTQGHFPIGLDAGGAAQVTTHDGEAVTGVDHAPQTLSLSTGVAHGVETNSSSWAGDLAPLMDAPMNPTEFKDRLRTMMREDRP